MLFIAEKPSLARALAEALPKPLQTKTGYIKASNGDIVSWCIGHLLEQAMPEMYDMRYKKWQLQDLPIIPDKWLLIPKENTKTQFDILVKLIKSNSEIVHVGDPDREGQLLVDEVLNYCQLPREKRKAIKRCLISDLNTKSIERSLTNLRSNQDFIPLSISALARARADWLYGINMSRVCTLVSRKMGYQGMISIGRVQTPILGLVVRREKEIEQFVAKPYYEVYAILQTQHNETFRAKWQPSDACAPYQDEEGRVLNKKLAENVCQRIQGKEGIVTHVSNKKKELNQPLPFNLSSLQIEMAKKYNLNAQQVLDICQTLYEKHKLITYPRSDCRYLPKEHLTQISQIKSAIAANLPNLNIVIEHADFKIRSKAWDDKKITAHHAIIPTFAKVKIEKLAANEIRVYNSITLQYLVQFYPIHLYAELQIDVDIQSGKFIAKATQVLDEGWKVLFKNKISQAVNKSDLSDTENNNGLLNKLIKKNDNVLCINSELLNKETQPPRSFNDASLLSALTGIARFVKNPEIKKILRETDGLGTEATRAGIIDLLFKRGFLIRSGKMIKATPIGHNLINALPDSMSTPDMTANWESKLNEISQKSFSYQSFMQQLTVSLDELVERLKHCKING